MFVYVHSKTEYSGPESVNRRYHCRAGSEATNRAVWRLNLN